MNKAVTSPDFIPPITNGYQKRVYLLSAIAAFLLLLASSFISFSPPAKSDVVVTPLVELTRGVDPVLLLAPIETLTVEQEALDASVIFDEANASAHRNSIDDTQDNSPEIEAMLARVNQEQIKIAEDEIRMRMMAPSVLNNKAAELNGTGRDGADLVSPSYQRIQDQLTQLTSVPTEQGVGNPYVVDERSANERFSDRQTNRQTAVAYASGRWDLSHTILEGKFISAVLENAIDSSLPGRVRAIVDRDVYAEKGQTVLIPRGSRLVGEYNSQIQQGQQRIFVFWKRMIRPDGVDIMLDSSGTDTLGRSGMAGSVNTHFWTRFGTSILLSLIGGGTANMGSATDQGSPSLYRTAIAQAFGNSSRQELDRYTRVPPTISLSQGEVIHVFVAKDLAFSPTLAVTR